MFIFFFSLWGGLKRSCRYSFRHVAYDLAQEDLTKIMLVQDIWRPIQLRFFDQAGDYASIASDLDQFPCIPTHTLVSADQIESLLT